MADNENVETEGSMIERMMKGEFDNIEIAEDSTAQEAVNEEAEEELNSGSNQAEEDGGESEDNPADNEDTKDDVSSGEEADLGSETNDMIDGEGQENDDKTDGTTDGKEPDNTLVESDKKDDVETKDQGDGSDSDNAEPNYKEEYEKLLNESKTYKDYYDTVTSEFTANGVKVKGFTDPKKVIQAQQALYGLEDKFSALKKYREFHAPLEKRGMVKDQAKFDLAMNIMDGDKEAIKAHMKALNINPIDLDLEEVAYNRVPTTSSEIEMNLDDVLSTSQSVGIRDQVEQVLYKDWDQDSVIDLLSTEGSRKMFVEHMTPNEHGQSVFKTVQAKAKEMSMIDNGSGFRDLSSIEKYNIALRELEAEHARQQAPAKTTAEVVKDTVSRAEAAEAKRIADAEAKAIEKYKAELDKKNKEADDARKKAASVSQSKVAPKKDKKEPDPMKLQGENFMDYWKQLEKFGR